MSQTIISIFLAIFTFFASLGIGVNSVKAPADESDFVPEVRFFVASDTHVTAAGDGRCAKIIKALTLAKSDAKQDENYKNLDAALFIGDLTDNGRKDQFIGFLSTANAVLDNRTTLMPVVAKSHDGNTLDKQSLSYFTASSGLDTDWHYVINGFHFIGLSASKTQGEQYSTYQREWLIKQLDEAVADDPSKPVFVCNHEHVKDTVYGSSNVDGWGIDYFKDIFTSYPQVVHFSGHSHYPINDPRSVWQGEFTAIGTGTMKSAELTIDGVNKIHPEKYEEVDQCWIVEVDKNNTVRLRGFDALSGSLLCEYYLDDIADVNARTLTPEKQEEASSAPVFPNGTKASYSFGKVKVSAADSTDGFPVFLYRAFVYDKDGNEKGSTYTANDYWKAETYKTVKIEIKASKGDTIKVFAENAYGMASEPVTITVK